MALRKLRYETDEILRKKSREVKEISPNIITLLDDMAETMQSFKGVGLAAPQVGVLRRVAIIDVGEGTIELINPEIVEMSGNQCVSEGCLSIPRKSGKVNRPEIVKAKYTDRNGIEQTIEGTGVLAIALCHELDHLEGILYIDKVTEMDEPEEDEDDESDEELEEGAE